MTAEELRRIALALPETSEQPHFEMTSFRVRGKIFATIPPDRQHAHVFVDDESVRMAVSLDASVFSELWWGKRLAGVRIGLAGADAGFVADLVADAWRCRAPKRVVKAFDAFR